MGLPSKGASVSKIYLKDKNEIAFDKTKNCSIFKNLFSNLAQNVEYKLSLSQISLLNLTLHPTITLI